MNTIFTNSENSMTSELHVLALKLTDKIDLRNGKKVIALSNLSIYYTWKNIKGSYNNKNLKYQPSHGMMNLSYLMDLILYQIYKITSNTF